MDFEDIPEAEEGHVIVQQEEPYFYEENPLKQQASAAEVTEEDPYYYEEPAHGANQMAAAVPEQDIWEMPEPEPEDALTYVEMVYTVCFRMTDLL